MGDQSFSSIMGEEHEKGCFQTNSAMDDEIIKVANTLADIGDSVSEIYEAGQQFNAQTWLQVGIFKCSEMATALMDGFLLWWDFNDSRRDTLVQEQEASNNNNKTIKETCRRMN